MPKEVCVVGAGVAGLSTALALCQAGHRVQVIAGRMPHATASTVAAAYWAPYWVGHYPRRWATETLTFLQGLAAEQIGGTRLTRFEEWLTEAGAAELRQQLETAYWWRDLPGINFAWHTDVPPRSMTTSDGQVCTFTQRVVFETPVARMPDYLAWLHYRLESEHGVRLTQRWFDSVDQIFDQVGDDVTVVNCTGWAAKVLIRDDPETANMRLLAGHVARVSGVNRDTAVSLHRGEFAARPLYLVPRAGSQADMICGGTAIEVTETPDPRQEVTFGKPEICEEVWQRCLAFDPGLTKCTGKEYLVALRPTRSSVRVEQDPRRANLFHNYGHGGAGLTLSWGSAMAVCQALC